MPDPQTVSLHKISSAKLLNALQKLSERLDRRSGSAMVRPLQIPATSPLQASNKSWNIRGK